MGWTAPNGVFIKLPPERRGIYSATRAGGSGIAHYWSMTESDVPLNNTVTINGYAQSKLASKGSTASLTSAGWGHADIDGQGQYVAAGADFSNSSYNLFLNSTPSFTFEGIISIISGVGSENHGAGTSLSGYEFTLGGGGDGSGLVRIMATKGTTTLNPNDQIGIGIIVYPSYRWTHSTSQTIHVADGISHHIMVTWASGNPSGVMKVYVDGVLVNTNTSAIGTVPSMRGQSFLKYGTYSNVAGYVKDAALWWGVTLTEADITGLPPTTKAQVTSGKDFVASDFNEW